LHPEASPGDAEIAISENFGLYQPDFRVILASIMVFSGNFRV
jgi:hypothetical protein